MPGGVIRAGTILTDQYGGNTDGSEGFNTTDADWTYRGQSGQWMHVPKRKYLTADTTIGSTSLTTIAALGIAVAASPAVYVCKWIMRFSQATSTTSQFTLSATTMTSTQYQVERRMMSTATAEAILRTQGTTGFPGTAMAAGTVIAGTNSICVIEAWVKVNAAGTINLQHASGGATTLTTYAGSYVEWNRI